MSLKNITININSASETVQSLRIAGGEGGAGARGQGVRIKALANVKYHFTDEATGYGPENMATKRVGKNLHIAFEGGDVDQPDLVIEDYYKDNGEIGYGEGSDNLLVGTHENGNVYPYVPESAVSTDAVSMLADGVQAGQALGTSVAPVPLWWLPLLILPALGGGGSTPPPPVDHTPVITDLTPKGEGGDVAVLESALAIGSNPASPEEKGTGTFTISSPDGVKSLTIAGVEVIKDGALTGATVTTALGNQLKVTGYDAAGTVTYEYTLLDREEHPTADGNNNLFEDLEVVLTDNDGDKADAVLSVKIVDDVPSAQDDTYTQTAENAPVTGDVTTNDKAGADGAAATGPVALVADSLTGKGTLDLKADGTFTYTPAAGEEGDVTFKYTYTDRDGDSAEATVTITLQGDDVPVAVDVVAKVDDDGLPNANAVVGTGDDDQNAGETGAYTGDESVWSGMLGVVAGTGTDTPLSYTLVKPADGLVGQEQVTYTLSADGKLLTATVAAGEARAGTVLFTVEITDGATGAYKVTLVNAIKHPAGSDENNIDVVISYTVADSDVPADMDTGTITINFDDDTPVGKGVTATPVLDDDIQAGGNADGTGDVADAKSIARTAAGSLFAAGADGLKSIVVTAPAMKAIYVDAKGVATQEDVTWTPVTNADGSVTLTGTSTHYPTATPVAVLTVYADGSYAYTQNAPVVNPTAGTTEETTDFAFGVTVTDGDDDTAAATLTVQINDDTPVGKTAVAPKLLQDEAQTLFPPNREAGVENLKTVTGDAGALFAAGADGLKSVAMTAPPQLSVIAKGTDGLPKQEAVTWLEPSVAADGSTTWKAVSASYPEASPALILVVRADGSYDLTVNAPLVHATQGEDDKLLNFAFTVTDGDGDSANGSLAVTINDDVSMLGAFTAGSLANQAGAVATGTFQYGSGADGWAKFDIAQSSGPSLFFKTEYTATGTILHAYSDAGFTKPVYDLNVNPDGTYSFTLITPEPPITATASFLGVDSGGPKAWIDFAGGLIEVNAYLNGEGINASVPGMGVGNNHFSAGESMVFEFFETGDMATNNIHGVNGRELTSITFTTDGGTATMNWTAYNYGEDGTTILASQSGTASTSGSTLAIDPTIQFDTLVLTVTSGTTRLKSVSYTYTEIAPDQQYTFDITATDGDGDVTTAQVLNIQQNSTPPAVGAATDGGAVTTALTDMQDASPYVLI